MTAWSSSSALRVASLSALFAWTYLSWPGLSSEFREAPARWALLAFVVTGLVCAALPRLPRAIDGLLLKVPARVYLAMVSTLGASLTAWFHLRPMRGMLLARDSAVYWLQARAMAHFSFGVPAVLPRPAAGVHFVFEGHDGLLHGVFAPGYPLALAPFTGMGALGPPLAAVLTSTLLVYSQEKLARAALPRLEDERTVRWSLLLPLASLARTTETADLLSHAFVAALAALCFAWVLEPGAAPSKRERTVRALALGVCGGWLFAARMLDGLLLAASLAPLLLARVLRDSPRRIPAKSLVLVLCAALPFAGLIALQQRAATGSFRTPTSVAYARNADYPPTCLRLGFGRDVGCRVEHRDAVASFGPDGYTPRAALRVVRERAAALGPDLVGCAWLLALAFAAALRRPRARVAWLAVFPLVLTAGYSLFYYGNAPLFGARHLYPGAPFAYVLLASLLTPDPRARATRLSSLHLAPAALAAVVATVPARWSYGLLATKLIQAPREPLRASLDGRATGLFLAADLTSYLATLDPWTDGNIRALVPDDHAGTFESRRAHPGWPLYLTPPDGDVTALPLGPPSPGFDVEIERFWPAYLRVDRLGAAPLDVSRCCGAPARGNLVLFLFEASVGARASGRFDVARGGDYSVALLGVAGPDHGDYDVRIDDRVVGHWQGYAPRFTPRRTELRDVGSLATGPHEVTFVCTGRDERSRGYVAAFDALTGRVAETPAPESPAAEAPAPSPPP